jgi:hypothetical protein
VCYAGLPGRGEKLIAPVRKFGPPVVDQIGPIPYLAVQRMFNDAFPPGRYNYWKSNLTPEISDDLIAAVVEHMARVPSPHSAVMLEHYHGVYSRRRPAEPLSFAKTPPGGQLVDLSALFRRESELDDQPPAPPASTPPLPLRRPPPARPGEPRLAPPARRVQANGDPAQASHD